MQTADHEHVSFCYDESTGLEAIVAIHDTTLGPALGGTRFLPYDSEADALEDVLRLAKAMTYKAAAADLDLGGGKAVILGDPEDLKTDDLLAAYGRAVDGLGGRYITTEDMNTAVDDMDVVATETDAVVGTSSGLGDPSPVTAHGVFEGIRACLEHRYGDDSLTGVSVLVQGVGKVGSHLAERLAEAGATVSVSDPDPEARRHVQSAVDAEVGTVPIDEALTEPCDVFAPCAASHLGLGSADALRDAIPDLACDIVAGSANNALGDHREATEHARLLAEEDILYAPDYVINAGGLILTAHEWTGGDRESAYRDAERIRPRLARLFEEVEGTTTTTVEAANALAEQRFR